MREKMERFSKYMAFKGLNDNKVTAQCGLGQGLLSQARSGKSDLGSKTIDKILITYQDLSKVWLLTGEGEMLKDPPPIDEQTAIVNYQTGNGNHFESNPTVNRFLDELAAQRELYKQQLIKSQEQMDRLITIIEKFKE